MKRALFLQYFISALFGAGVAAGAVQFHRHCTALSAWAILPVCIFSVLILCLLFAYKCSAGFVRSISDINHEMAQHGEQMSFSSLEGSRYPEISALHENIRMLCGKIIASRKKLRQQQERFDFIIDNMDSGILVTTLGGTVIGINKKASELLEIGNTALNKNISQIISDQAVLNAAKNAAVHNQITHFDFRTTDGKIYSLSSHLIHEEPDDDSLPRQRLIVITISDVTSERSALRQRQDFFSNASHELKTPITSIQGFAELLESGMLTDPDKIKDSLHIISREASRMNRIISDLLMISSLENSRKVDSAPEMVDIEALIEEIRDSLRISMMERNITMEISGGHFSIPIVYTHIHNLFANLMQNAVKYNVPDGKVWVRAEIDGQYLHITVKDTGIGIPADMKSRIFERFFRVDKGRSRSIGGTGLGLSIVKHIVSLYDGDIHLDSVLGEGTIIHTCLRYQHLSDPEIVPAPENSFSDEGIS